MGAPSSCGKVAQPWKVFEEEKGVSLDTFPLKTCHPSRRLPHDLCDTLGGGMRGFLQLPTTEHEELGAHPERPCMLGWRTALADEGLRLGVWDDAAVRGNSWSSKWGRWLGLCCSVFSSVCASVWNKTGVEQYEAGESRELKPLGYVGESIGICQTSATARGIPEISFFFPKREIRICVV